MMDSGFRKWFVLRALGLTLGMLGSFLVLPETHAQTRWDNMERTRENDLGSYQRLWQGGWLGGQTQVDRKWQLGITGDNADVGVRVRNVTTGSAASRARIERDDIIVSVNGFQVGMVDGRVYDLAEEIDRRAGDTGVVSLLVQDHRSLRLAAVRVQLDSRQHTLTGTLVFPSRDRVPTDAVVTVKIDNVTRSYYQVRQGQTVFRANGGLEMPFEIHYDPNYINPEDTYQVRAFVTWNDRTIFDTRRPQRVLTQGNPSNVRLELVSLRSPSTGTGGVITAGYPNFNQIDDRIVAMYRRYLGREPSFLELAALRATPGVIDRLDSLPLELMAAQEYFDAAGNNNRVWLESVFQEVVGRPASQTELDQWMQRYANLRYSRTELLRQLYSQVRR